MKHPFLYFLFSVTLFSCSEGELIRQLQDLDISKTPTGVVPLPEGYHEKMNAVFTKYTNIKAQNGRPIHFFAQPGVADEKVMKVREVMRMHLTDVPGSEFGSSKFFIGNSMANVNAAMFIFEDIQQLLSHEDDLETVPFNWQFTLAEFTTLPGDPDYLSGKAEITYEETIHLVHDTGIFPMLPLYQEQIQDAAEKALNTGIYVFIHIGVDGQAPDEDLDNEYFANAYYAYTSAGVAPWGTFERKYLPTTRATLKAQDPDGYALMKAFFHEYFTYNARIYSGFDENFSLTFDPSIKYTYRSQYIQYATLTGSLNSGLTGNARDNHLTGNAGNNALNGKQGNDQLDGKEGIDTAVFSGKRTDYVITEETGTTMVEDKIPGRDGVDRLTNIEHIKFQDTTLTLPL